MNLIQLDQLAVLGNGNKRGWLEWDGARMFLAASPSGVEPPPLPPEIPPVVVDPVDPTPENPNPNPDPTVPVDATTETVYTDPGTYQYIVPKGITKLDYVLIGAGGAGGTGYMLNWNAGGGGQAGQVRVGQIAVKAGDVVTIVIGTGGSPRGSAGSSGNPGTQSSLSINGNVVVAYGGDGGGAGAPGNIGGSGYSYGPPGAGAQAAVEVLGGGNIPGGWGNLTSDVDAYGIYTDAYGSKPHKNGGRGGTNGLGAGGEGGPWSWNGPGPEISPGRAGGWPGGGGGGAGSDEGTGIAPGGYGANGGAYLFTGQGYLRRFPSGVAERSPLDRAGANTKCVYSYTAVPANDNNGCCVGANSLIHTPNGDIRIDALSVGDSVYSYDLEQGAIVPNVIVGISVHRREALYDVHFADGRILPITDDHPMLTESGWASFDPSKTFDSYLGLRALDFSAESKLVFVGKDVQIVRIEQRLGPFDTYTLSVGGEENTQSFIADYVIVHNRRRCD